MFSALGWACTKKFRRIFQCEGQRKLVRPRADNKIARAKNSGGAANSRAGASALAVGFEISPNFYEKSPHCQAKIAGRITYSNVWGQDDFEVPAFCIECGKAYPWTEKKIAAAKELAKELEGITPDEIQVLETSIVEISQNNPQAQVGATRIKKIMEKVTSASGEVLRSVIIDVASTAAKKVLLGQ